MVGVPKSAGCALCLKRGVKCDEASPSCYQCRRGGRNCPGYEKRIKFVDEGPKLRSKSSAVVNHNPKMEQSVSSQFVQRLQLVSRFVEDLFPLGRHTVQYSFIGSWLWNVPQRTKWSVAMELAAESLALAHFAKMSNSDKPIMRSREIYSLALYSLSKALICPASRLSSETLCATLLLVHYETFLDVKEGAWVTHAGGAGRLIQLRGAHRHRSAFDYSMLLASRGYIISEAMANKEECFLDDDAWRNLPFASSPSPLLPEYSGYFQEGLNHFAAIPGLLKRARLIFEGRSNSLLDVLTDAENLRKILLAWFHNFNLASGQTQNATAIPSQDEGILPNRLVYKDSMTASFTTNYCVYLIRLNSVIDSLQEKPLYDEDNVQLALCICMSTEYCLRGGFCGAQTMYGALPVACSVLPTEYSGWIHEWMKKIGGVQHSPKLQSQLVENS